MSKHKTFVIILAVVIIAAEAGGIAYLLHNKPLEKHLQITTSPQFFYPSNSSFGVLVSPNSTANTFSINITVDSLSKNVTFSSVTFNPDPRIFNVTSLTYNDYLFTTHNNTMKVNMTIPEYSSYTHEVPISGASYLFMLLPEESMHVCISFQFSKEGIQNLYAIGGFVIGTEINYTFVIAEKPYTVTAIIS